MPGGWIETKFGKFAAAASWWAGGPAVFAAALIFVVVWAACGPFFDYSQAWQMIINTATTICTFLMVFVIQNSQNREGLALQIKLDEVIRALHGATNRMIDLEDLPQHELEKLRAAFAELGEAARKRDED